MDGKGSIQDTTKAYFIRKGFVFYQHQHPNLPVHGKFEAEKRAEKKLLKLVYKYHQGKQLGKNQLRRVLNFLAHQ